MTGRRVYLDWNASAPLRPEARAAMIAALEEAGNPSSVHAEGRRARAIVERARAQVAAFAGVAPSEIVFASGASEGLSAVAASRRWRRVLTSGVEHDAAAKAVERAGAETYRLGAGRNGALLIDDAGEHPQAVEGMEDDPWLFPCSSGPLYGREPSLMTDREDLVCLQAANSETGVYHQLDRFMDGAGRNVSFLCDLTALAGRAVKAPAGSGATAPKDAFGEHAREHVYSHGVISAHKFGGPKGVGAVIVREGAELSPLVAGGGQELGRRSGTENVAGIAGMGAAAEAAARDLAAGVWDDVAALRDLLEDRLASAAPDLHIVGREAPRLANTSCLAVPGWRGETQVMGLDLAGFAVSAGSACSSGKVAKASRVLTALGYDETTAGSAIRVSLGPTTTEAEVMAFADAWETACRRWRAKAA